MVDVVERLRKVKSIGGYFKDELSQEAADTIERMREAMIDIMVLVGDLDRRQEIMDIVKPYAIQQLALKGIINDKANIEHDPKA